jgi:hypothetical protein
MLADAFYHIHRTCTDQSTCCAFWYRYLKAFFFPLFFLLRAMALSWSCWGNPNPQLYLEIYYPTYFWYHKSCPQFQMRRLHIHTATLYSWFGCYSHVQLWFVCPIVPLSNHKCMYQVQLTLLWNSAQDVLRRSKFYPVLGSSLNF